MYIYYISKIQTTYYDQNKIIIIKKIQTTYYDKNQIIIFNIKINIIQFFHK